MDAPLHAEGGTAVLYGNLCPDGAVIKPTAASPHLLEHLGKAFVFERYEEMKQQVEREDLPKPQSRPPSLTPPPSASLPIV
jgi:dihydroxy-acid dehydratase